MKTYFTILLIFASCIPVFQNEIIAQTGNPPIQNKIDSSDIAIIAPITIRKQKLKKSKKYNASKEVHNYRGLTGFTKIVKPVYKKAAFSIRFRPLSSKTEEVKKHVKEYYQGKIYVNHFSNKGICSSIIVLEEKMTSSFSAKFDAEPIQAMKILSKLPLELYPTKTKVYISLLGLVKTEQEKLRAIGLAPDDKTMYLACLYYLRAYDDLKTLKRKSKNIPNSVMDPDEALCASALRFINESTISYITNELGCDPKTAIYKLVERSPCYELSNIAETLPETYRQLFFKIAECHIAECVDSEADHYNYVSKFGTNSKCIKSSVSNVIAFLESKNELWPFLEVNQSLIQDHKNLVAKNIKNAVQNGRHLKTYHKIYSANDELKWGFEYGINNLPISEVEYLIKENVYNKIQSFVDHRIFLQTDNNLEWAYLYLRNFYKDKNQRKKVYLNAFAQENKQEIKNAYILDYLKEYGKEGITQIEPYWKSCSLRFYIATSNENLAVLIAQECLECVNDYKDFTTYASIGVYNPHLDGFNQINRTLTPKQLRTLYGKFPHLKDAIGDIFVEKAETVGDIDWFLSKFHDDGKFDLKGASLKGLQLQKQINGKGAALTKRVATHLLNEKFSFDPSLVSEYVGSDQMLALLKMVKTARWVEELFNVASKSITPRNIEQFDPYFGHLPNFQEKVVDAILESIQSSPKTDKTIPSLSKDSVFVDSISTVDYNNPLVVLNVEGDLDKNVRYRLIDRYGNVINEFSNEDKTIFIDTKSTYAKLVISNQKRAIPIINKNPKSARISYTVVDCPVALLGIFKSTLNSPSLREKTLQSTERILDNNSSIEDYKLILGAGLTSLAGQSKNLDKKLDLLSLEVAKLYLNTARPYYPSKRIDRVLNNIGQYLEKLARSKLN